MKKTYCLFIAFLLSSQTFSQSIPTHIGARANGIGYASSSLFDAWGIFNNIAGISKIKGTTAAVSSALHPSLTGAGQIAAVVATPLKFGAAAAGVYRFGDDLYNEQILSAGIGTQFGLAALGMQANYIQYRAEGFNTKGVVSFNLGGIAELTSQLSVGAYIVNVNQPSLNSEEKLPTRLVAGLGFKPVEKVFITTEIEKDVDYDPTWKMGIEYCFHTKFTARTGYNINPNTAFFGFGFKSRKLNIDYALQHTTLISFGHQATLSYQFGKK